MQSLLLGCNKLLVVIGKLVDVAVVVTVVVDPVDVVVGAVVVVEAVDSLLNSVEVVTVVNSFSDQINESFIKDSSGSKISISSPVALGCVIGAIVGTKISFKIITVQTDRYTVEAPNHIQPMSGFACLVLSGEGPCNSTYK